MNTSKIKYQKLSSLKNQFVPCRICLYDVINIHRVLCAVCQSTWQEHSNWVGQELHHHHEVLECPQLLDQMERNLHKNVQTVTSNVFFDNYILRFSITTQLHRDLNTTNRGKWASIIIHGGVLLPMWNILLLLGLKFTVGIISMMYYESAPKIMSCSETQVKQVHFCG